MSLIQITRPATLPVTLDEVKDQLSIERTDTQHDDLLTRLMASAVASLDGPRGHLGRAMIRQTWRYGFDAFPHRDIALPMPPILAVTAVGYVDSSGVERVIDPANYGVFGRGSLDGATVRRIDAYSWPTAGRVPGAAYVEFEAGFGDDADAVPADLRHAICAMVGTAFLARESVFVTQSTPTPVAEIEAAIDRHRVWSF